MGGKPQMSLRKINFEYVSLNFDEFLWYLKLNSEVRGRCKLIFERCECSGRCYSQGWHGRILEFYFQFKSRLAIRKNRCQRFLRVVPLVPTHKFNLFELMSKEKIKSYTKLP